MSLDYTACYRLSTPIARVEAVRAFNERYDITYLGCRSFYQVEPDGDLKENLCPSKDWDAYVREMAETSASLNAQWSHGPFQFTIGFVGVEGERYCILEISDRSLGRLTIHLRRKVRMPWSTSPSFSTPWEQARWP